MIEKKPRVSLEHAQELLLQQVTAVPETETVDLLEVSGRVAYEDITAVIDQPPFDRSPLDGYAVCHRDTAGAARGTPVTLRVTQHIFAGECPDRPVNSGEAARIMTGAMLPRGADCVIMQEETDMGEDSVKIYQELGEYKNYCFAGEDLKKGQRLITAGQCLNYAHAGVLAGQGIGSVRVFARPRVGVLATGDELAPAGGQLLSGKIYDSNSILLSGRLKSLGLDPVQAPYCGDSPEALAEAVLSLLDSCDMVITTGGVSVGQKDYMPTVSDVIGAKPLFAGVAVKPGSPALGMVKNGKLVLCLSGNPFAAAAMFEVLARPVLEKMRGNADYMPVRQTGTTQSDFGKASGMRRLIRAQIKGKEVFIPQEGHASGMLGTLAQCNCMIDIPAQSPPIRRGMQVEVILI